MTHDTLYATFAGIILTLSLAYPLQTALWRDYAAELARPIRPRHHRRPRKYPHRAAKAMAFLCLLSALIGLLTCLNTLATNTDTAGDRRSVVLSVLTLAVVNTLAVYRKMAASLKPAG